jgi:hypothetical protein
MPTPDQVGSPFRAAGALPVDRRYGGKITAYDQLPIHALGDQYVVEGNGTITSLPALPIGETVFLQMAGTSTFTNSARLLCPNNVNYVAVAGDLVVARSNGDGIWRIYVLSAAGSVASYNTRAGAVTATGTDVPLRSYLSGLTLSTAGASATFGIAPGVATDSTNAAMMALASAYTKNMNAWAVGTGNGSWDGTGTSPLSGGNVGWYHAFLIQRTDTGVVDVLISQSATAPTLPTNYTLFRRIGSLKVNGSAQWTKFAQVDDKFILDTSVGDVAGATPSISGVSVTLTVPPGVVVSALFRAALNGGGTNMMAFSSLLESVQASGSGGYASIGSSATIAGGHFEVPTNTSAQIRTIGSAAVGTYSIQTYGWTDTRGRLS